MRALAKEKAQEIKAGVGHYHWKCTDGEDFISAPYSSFATAGAAADKHIKNFPAHAKKVTVYYCEKSSCS